MKKFKILGTVLALAFSFTSCEDFLDTVPDNRTELNSVDKVTKLLVSAYPLSYPMLMWELASDNAMDNGKMYDIETQTVEDAYLWNDVKTETDDDSPQGLWDRCYMAISSANHALQAIEQMGDGEAWNAQKGEALLCRAYAHFLLANTFCEAYNPQTAASKLGIPYVTEPETEVAPVYTRGTLQEVYEKIEADILKGLPLIDDNLYSVPKYHFNKKAANAFAARFYLFYVQEDKSNYEKVLQYGEQVLGKNPYSVLRHYQEELGSFNDPSNISDAFINVKSAANLLITPVYSSWPYIYGPYNLSKRYGMSNTITRSETLWANGVWGSAGTTFYNSLFGNEQKRSFVKYGMYFEYTDKVNGIGYRHAVVVPFITDETLMCCAEAYVMKTQPDYAKAVEYMNYWIDSHKGDGSYGDPEHVTEESVVEYYKKINYTPVPVTDDSQRTVKRQLNPPFGFVDEKQENFMHCILQMRRIELIHGGERWLDIKRYNIEISHNRDGLSPDVLKKDDLRRAMQLPQDVIGAGLEANPR